MSRHKLFFLFLVIITSAAIPQARVKNAGSLQDIVNQVNSDTLTYFIKELSGMVATNIGGTMTTIQSRNKNQPGNEQATQYIRQKLQSYGMTTTLQSFSTTGKNILGVQTGTVFPNQKYIICAHFDDMPSGSIAPGADDNGSGTAAVLEAARILKNYSFPFSIVYALWDEEEQGLVGSDYYAAAARQAGDSIAGVINLDMISWERNGDNKFNLHARPVANSMDIAAKVTELNTTLAIGLVPVLKNPGITASDHASFWSENYSAVLLIEDDDNDFNAYYHTVNDKLSEFNMPYFKKMTQLSIATLASYAMNLNIQIAHTPQPSVIIKDKIQIMANLFSGITLGSGTLAVSGTEDAPGVFRFGLPYLTVGTAVQYYIAAQDSASRVIVTSPKGGSGFNPPGQVPPPTFHQFFVAPKTLLVSDSANSISRWTVSGTWATTTSKYVSAPSSFTDSPTGQYANNVTASMTFTAPINLSQCLGAQLEFDAQWDLESGYDYVQIQVSTNNGSTWTAMAGSFTTVGSGSFQPAGQPLYNGTRTSWVHEKIDMAGFAGKTINIRFLLRTDGSQVKDGMYIDNVLFTSYQPVAYELYLYAIEKSVNGKVTIRWKSSTELQNSGYSIERSKDNSNWYQIGKVSNTLAASEGREFSYTDNTPLDGLNYYRVCSISHSGESIPQSPLAVESTRPAVYSLEQNYPNPF
ncbi:MAG: M20/M25/M40 family metallo-hydrolase, partial [Ignavibacteriales bacterium]|nr:M20/M25/M40 family metallo-hydrolase [Ignavibacteriales bacterium]